LQSTAAMKKCLLLVAVIALHGCLSDDYSDETWSSGGDDSQAELEDASLNEDVTPAPVDTDDTDDLAEVDDDTLATEPDDLVAMATKHYQNSVADNCADPGVIRVATANGVEFYAACTGNGFPLYKSSDLVHWTSIGHIFSAKTKPAWGSGNWWAPEIHHIGTGYVAYFVALSSARKRMCIGAATASSPSGPFKDLGHPLVCDSHFGLIDPDVYTDGDGHHWLYYKIDGNAQNPPVKTIIYGQRMRDDGLGFVGVRHRMIENTLPWEHLVTEAPWVMHRGKYFYMFYSGATYCNGTYGVGVARATSPLGPFHKRSQPILHSNSKWDGPGHNSIVSSGGHQFIVYHAWRGAHACTDDGHRELMLDWIHWKGGWPYINDGTPSRGVHTAPTVP
jgi:beta-xylosidase